MIAYHGTTRANAASIRKHGFRPGTYFALKKRDAMKFGGPVVLAARFSDDPLIWHGEDNGWQFWIRHNLPASELL